jgi:hypothetical protein
MSSGKGCDRALYLYCMIQNFGVVAVQCLGRGRHQRAIAHQAPGSIYRPKLPRGFRRSKDLISLHWWLSCSRTALADEINLTSILPGLARFGVEKDSDDLLKSSA